MNFLIIARISVALGMDWRCIYAVNIPSFRDSRFSVIDSVWESEIQGLPGKLRFMAGIFRRMADVGYGCLIRHF
jgi:hypothetical protein